MIRMLFFWLLTTGIVGLIFLNLKGVWKIRRPIMSAVMCSTLAAAIISAIVLMF